MPISPTASVASFRTHLTPPNKQGKTQALTASHKTSAPAHEAEPSFLYAQG